MAVIKLTNFGGLRPKDSARALPDDGAQIAHNLLATTSEFRPLGADTTIVAATGVNNPTTIYRMQRVAGGGLNTDFTSALAWKISAGERSYVKGPNNDNATERTYLTFNDGSQAPRVIDNAGQDRQLGVPAPTTKPAVTVNVVDEFTVEERGTAIDSALQTAISAIDGALTPQWRGADRPGTSTQGYIDQLTAYGFPQDNPARQARVYRLDGANAITNSYCSVAASNFSWVFDPLLAPVFGPSTGTPSWTAPAGTQHVGLTYCAYGLTYDLNTSGLTTALAAIPMPGTTDGTKFFSGAQVTAIVTALQGWTDYNGTEVKPKLDALRTKVLEVKGLLDGGARSSLVQMTQAFYSKSDVASEISAAISNFANNVFQQADLVARSSLPAEDFGGAGAAPL